MRRSRSAPLTKAAVAGLFGLLLAGHSAAPAQGAATTELVVADKLSGLALYGFDPVAYFLDETARLGERAFELSFSGLTWRFYNESNRAAFSAQPEVYAPRFGGYDPVALVRGAPVPGHPALFVVHNERLFLFHRSESRDAFLAEPAAVIEAAQSAWPKVRRTLVP